MTLPRGKLPGRLEDLRGLRAARWVRESTAGQVDHFGPDAQCEQQDRAIDRHELVDTGIAWTVAHSGRTVANTDQFRDMLARAGVDYDVLLVGYVSRFARNLKATLVAIEDGLHPAGAAVLFCDEQVLSSNPDSWADWTREAHEAENYSRRLGRRIREGYAAKFSRLADQGGNAPAGFRRIGGRLEVDPERIGTVVTLFEEFATGGLSIRALAAQHGLDPDGLRATLTNPVYNGWVRRHRRRTDEQLLPALWRNDPPVSDELWARCEQVRRRRYHGGGHPTRRHHHLLRGLLYCPCGARIGSELHGGSRRYRHRDRCTAWPRSTVPAWRLDDAIGEQVRRTRLTPAHLASLRRLASVDQAPQPVLLRRQLERELEDRARAHARRQISTEAYLAEHARISQRLEQLRAEPATSIDPDRAVAFVTDLQQAWRHADLAARHQLVSALYDRIVVSSGGFVEVTLSASAEQHGLAVLMPEQVVVGVRPAGNGRSPATVMVRIPIAGRQAWRQLLRRTA